MGDKIKTYTVGCIEGFMSAFEKLDKLVEGLGDITIKSVKDKYYILQGINHDSSRPGEEVVSRVVVYTQNPKKNIPGGPVR